MEIKKAKNRYNNMTYRCNNNIKGYELTTVSNEWREFEEYYNWIELNFVEGWEIDKDILSGTNKSYSPDTCLMVPREINALFRRSKSKHGYKGVYFDKRDNKYYAQMRIDGKTKNCGSSITANGAHKLYLEQRKIHLKELLERYKAIENHHAYDRLVEALQQYL